MKSDPAPPDNAALPSTGLARRLAALTYDVLLLAAILMLATLPIMLAAGGEAIPSGNLAYRLMLLGISWVFFAGFWARGGQTLGMRAWRLQLVDRQGRVPGAGTCALRFAAALVSLAAAGLGFGWQLVDRDRLTWHDRWCGTRVCVLPKRGARN